MHVQRQATRLTIAHGTPAASCVSIRWGTLAHTSRPMPPLPAGAIVGLAALGHSTVRLLLLPQLHPYMRRLQPLLDPDIPEGAFRSCMSLSCLQAVTQTEATTGLRPWLDPSIPRGATRNRV